MSLHSVSELNSLKDPLKQYQFKFVISGMAGSSFNPEKLELQCSAFNVPGNKIKTVQTVIGTHYRTRAALQDKAGTWRTTIYDTQGGEVWNALQKWFDLINNPTTGLIAVSSQYVREAEIQILDEDNIIAKSIYLYGVYPITLSQIEIKASSSEPISLAVDWNYDWFSTSKVGPSLTASSGLLSRLKI